MSGNGGDGDVLSTSMNATHSTTPEGAFMRVLQVNVSRVCNVATTREEGAWVTFTVDFDGNTAQSSEALQPAGEVPLNYECTFDVVTETATDVERMVNSTINFTVTEHIKEKKKKHETTTRLGAFSVDALPLLLGKDVVQGTYQLNLAPNISLPETMSFDVAVSAPRPLMSEHQINEINILTCTVQSVSKLPQQLLHTTTASTFSLRVGEVDGPLNIEFADGQAVAVPEENEDSVAFEVDNTDVSAPLTTDNTHINFPSQRHRICLDHEQQQRMIEYISRNRSCPVSFSRAAATTGKSKSKVDDDVPTQRGVADLQLTHLLYPGVITATLGTKFTAVPEPQLDESTLLLDDAKKSKSKKAPTPAVTDTAPPEGQVFEDAGTFVVLSFEFTRPLIRQRSPSAIAARVSSLIPPRDVRPSPLVTAQQALDGYKSRVAAIANDLVSQLRAAQQADSTLSQADVKQRVLYDLNTNGKYEAFKEQLKQTVMTLVREKFATVNELHSAQGRQEFLSKLYVYLTTQMHATLNREFSFNRPSSAGAVDVPMEHVMQFARESEGLLNLDKAQALWDECTQRFSNDAQCWFEYAAFSTRVGDTSKAEECLRRAVSIDQRHAQSLALLGLIAVLDGRAHEGLDLLEAATSIDDSSELMWTLRYLAVQHANPDDVAADLHLDTAMKNSMPRAGHYTSCLLLAADFLASMGLPVLAQSAVAGHIAMDGVCIGTRLIEARLDIMDPMSDSSKAQQLLDACLSDQFDDADLWAWLGHTQYPHHPDTARSHYEHALALEGTTGEEDIVRLRLGRIYLAEDDFALAKDMYLRTCNQRPSSLAWLGLGVACYRLGQLEDAEDALAEANMYDPRNPTVWAYLCLICLRTGRGLEAEQCFKFATKHNLTDTSLKQEIELEMQELGVEPALVA
ncbi:hypothetical protein PTSG_08751 [Salpingoeca rosetta]|uniref:Cilia- and flagella-associated protein 70 n=1 Tax=Salpingoeca rosetta (strain ATCC 50818 / BSB-021) TaxID=946362 RepID=F2UKL0_SALR5|nr:uncharacterized protein PTSG_08751 [Salpingoeca rosetta]EGD77659.1 hypothetical protein PTSG_08751 [Salpingoeca rosetta]|eukprot:XP_004990135.1 hypothetical protein PTSG_08751 [Salpingoeca rosetta]